MELEIVGRHRAMGDAEATVCLFEKVLAADKEGAVVKMLGGRTGETYLPPNLSAAQIENLPSTPGVYYFYGSEGKDRVCRKGNQSETAGSQPFQ